MQPGKRWAMALSNSSGDIQRPSWLTPPPSGVGTVSLWSLVTITVLLSTRATSLGSVLANQLQEEEEKGERRSGKCEEEDRGQRKRMEAQKRREQGDIKATFLKFRLFFYI